MHLRRLAIPAAIATAALLPLPAFAAVTVFGAGPAQLCYEAADTGVSPTENLIYCNEALAGALSTNDRAATYVNRGVIKLVIHQPDAASEDFNASIAINDHIGEAYVDLGAAQVIGKRYAEAIANITKGLSLGTKLPQNAYFDRGLANEALGNIKAAYDDYRQAVTLAPDFQPALQELKRFKVVEKPSGT